MNLERRERGGHRRIAGELLGHRRLGASAQPAVLEIGQAQHEQPRGVGCGGRVGDHLLHHLEARERGAEDHALLRVVDHHVDGGLGEAGCAGCDAEAPVLDRVHRPHAQRAGQSAGCNRKLRRFSADLRRTVATLDALVRHRAVL